MLKHVGTPVVGLPLSPAVQRGGREQIARANLLAGSRSGKPARHEKGPACPREEEAGQDEAEHAQHGRAASLHGLTPCPITAVASCDNLGQADKTNGLPT